MAGRKKTQALPPKLYTFQIVIEREPEGDGYTAYSPTLAGCFRRSSSVEEAKQSIREAVWEHLVELLARGDTIPQAERLIHVEELSIAVYDATKR